jgi:zinc transporter ZupT
MVLLIALLAVIATVLGGLFALHFKDKLHMVLGFSAGAVLGVAFFDLLPEALNLGSQHYTLSFITTLIALGFLAFMIIDRLVSIHAHTDDDNCENENHRGRVGAFALSIHSFLDGAAIGLAFQVSPAVGAIVAAAVLAHDFSDGINTVNLILKNQGSKVQALKWLAADALAPLLGVLASFLFHFSESTLGLILAIFCGFFLYIGASDLLPESHHQHPSAVTTLATLAGVAVLYLAVRLAGA